MRVLVLVLAVVLAATAAPSLAQVGDDRLTRTSISTTRPSPSLGCRPTVIRSFTRGSGLTR